MLLAIHYHATQNQPRPVLIGFTSELDKEFFEKLITVKDVGPLVAARALASPVGDIAAAIARQDEPYLRRLPGIGPQKAKNIVAQLSSKVAKFALVQRGAPPLESPVPAPAALDEGGLRGDGLRGDRQAARPPPREATAAHRPRRSGAGPEPPRPRSCSTRSTAGVRASDGRAGRTGETRRG